MSIRVRPLTAWPFRLQSPPADAYAHALWQRARAEVLAALLRGHSVALLGRAGTGKTLLLHSLADALRGRGRRVRLRSSPAWWSPVRPDEASADAILIDEADTLCATALRAVGAQAAPFVVAGLPGLAVGALARPVVTVVLEPLSAEEIAHVVVARLKRAGRAPSLFGPESVLALAQHSGGLLRLVLILAGAALFLAEQEGAGQVTARHVDDAAALRLDVAEPAPAQSAPQPPAVAPGPVRSRHRYTVAGMALCGVIGVGLWALAPRGAPSLVAIAKTAITPASAEPVAEPAIATPPPSALPSFPPLHVPAIRAWRPTRSSPSAAPSSRRAASSR